MTDETAAVALVGDDDFVLPAVSDQPRWTPPAKPQKGAGSDALPSETYNAILRQALDLLPNRLDDRGEINARNRQAMLTTIEALDPRDAIEAMLVGQIVGMHELVTNRMTRALKNSGPEGETAFQQANKASRTFGMLVETLNKHRGKGRQTMVVEHVHVHQGGQAIVGQVGGCDFEGRGQPKK